MRRQIWKLVFPLTVLVAVGVGLLRTPSAEPPARQHQVAGLQLSDAVIQAKIAREQAEAAGTDEEPNNPDGYSEFRRMMRPHPEGTTVIEMLLEAKKQTDRMPELAANKDAGIWNWEWLGPGNIGGRIRSILTHPTNPDILWIGSVSGGVWKTTNGGGSWFPQMSLLPSLCVSAMAMDPTDPDVIYAGTGEGLALNSLAGAGIFKSTDGGTNWTRLPSTFGVKYVNDLIIHPTNGQILLAAVFESGDGQIWRSLDAGVTWEPTFSYPGNQFTDVAMDPDNPEVVLASNITTCYRSDAMGAPGSWVVISNGHTDGLPSSIGRTTFSFGEGNDIVYASANVPRPEDTDHQGEIWLSADNGLTWTLRSRPYHLGKQGTYDNVIWLEPGSTQNIIFGGIGLYKSLNGGLTNDAMANWQVYHLGLSAHADQHVIVPSIQYGNNNATIYFGNDGGIQRTDLGFATGPTTGWHNLANNLGITQFYHADVSPSGDLILGGTQDNDDLRYYRSQGAESWYQATTGDGTYNAIDPLSQNRMYAAYVHLKMQRSTNGGDNYGYIINGLGDAGDKTRAAFVAPFALDKVYPNHLIAGGQSIWHTSDYGDHWAEVLAPVTNSPKCSATEISPTAGIKTTWVGYANGEIWKSENYTQDWTQVESSSGGSLPNSIVADIEISPHNSDAVIVVLAGYYSDRVWLTTDNGQSWTSLQGQGANTLPLVGVNCVTFHPSNPDWIYVGTDIGLFASEDMGQHWSVTPRYNLSEGPVYVEVSDLIWHSGESLVAVTYGRGLYECRPLTAVYVNAANSGNEDGTFWSPFNTFGEGYNFIGSGSSLIIFGGEYSEGARVMTKRIDLQGLEGSVIIK